MGDRPMRISGSSFFTCSLIEKSARAQIQQVGWSPAHGGKLPRSTSSGFL